MNETISIIIPNYNGKKLLGLNLPLIIKLKEEWKEICEIIVVDDKSTDDSIKFLSEKFPSLTIIKKHDNSGFIDTVNLGIEKAKGEFVLLLNTDVSPDSDIVPKLLMHFKDKKVFGVGCLDKSVEDGKVIERGRGIGIFLKGFLVHKRGQTNKDNTLWVSGGSAMFRKSTWQYLGGLDSIYSPFYWEDIDISYRALKAGYKILFDNKAQVVHKHEKGSIMSNYSSKQILEISLRNQILFVWKNISKPSYLLNHLIYLFWNICKGLGKGDIIYLSSFLKALLKIPVVVAHRCKQSRNWKYKDDEILSAFSSEFSSMS